MAKDRFQWLEKKEICMFVIAMVNWTVGESCKHHYPLCLSEEVPWHRRFQKRALSWGNILISVLELILETWRACVLVQGRCVCVFKISYSEINLRGIRDTSIQSTTGTKKLI